MSNVSLNQQKTQETIFLSGFQAYDESLQALSEGREELVPSEVVDRILAGENPVRVWRAVRGISQAQLARAAGISAAYLSQMETGKRDGKLEVLNRIAGALDLTIDDILVLDRWSAFLRLE